MLVIGNQFGWGGGREFWGGFNPNDRGNNGTNSINARMLERDVAIADRRREATASQPEVTTSLTHEAGHALSSPAGNSPSESGDKVSLPLVALLDESIVLEPAIAAPFVAGVDNQLSIDTGDPPPPPSAGIVAGRGFDQGPIIRSRLDAQLSVILVEEGARLARPGYVSPALTVAETSQNGAFREITHPLPQLGRPVTMEDIATSLLSDGFGLYREQIQSLDAFVGATADSFRTRGEPGAIFYNEEYPQGAARITVPANVFDELTRMGNRTSPGGMAAMAAVGGTLSLSRALPLAGGAAAAELTIPLALLALPTILTAQHMIEAGRISSPPPLIEMPPPPPLPPLSGRERERSVSTLPPVTALDSRRVEGLPPASTGHPLPPIGLPPFTTDEHARRLTAPMMSGGSIPLTLTPTGDIDPAADALAKEIGGVSSVMIAGFENREFDAVSDLYVAQSSNSANAAINPGNFLNQSKKAQIRGTLRAATETGRTALFEFTNGAPAQEVIDFIQRNADRIRAKFEIKVK